MALLTETTKQLGDLLIWEANFQHNREQCALVNPIATARTGLSLFGMPVGAITRVDDNHYSAALLAAGSEANVKGIVLAMDTIDIGASATTTKYYGVLVRGPAVINKNWIKATDAAAAAYNIANLAAALVALGITVRAEPVKAMSW